MHNCEKIFLVPICERVPLNKPKMEKPYLIYPNLIEFFPVFRIVYVFLSIRAILEHYVKVWIWSFTSLMQKEQLES